MSSCYTKVAGAFNKSFYIIHFIMNRSELIAAVAQRTGTNKATAAHMVDAVFGVIADTLTENKQEVAIEEGKSSPSYGAAVSVYFTLDKSLIPIKEENDAEDQER